MKLDRTEKGGYILKRIFAFLFVVTILFTACSGGGNFRVGESKYSIKELDEFFLNDGEYDGNSSYNCKIRSYDEVDDKFPVENVR